MTSDEIRSAFLNFFEQKGHEIVPSSSLIPHGDPTLLLASAGMVQFKPYYLGEVVPSNPRLASCQKCFRTTDIESVGDTNHLTFFEMLGNFSIGDYFKQESIDWAWEFVTQYLGLPVERLWVSIFLDDEESFDIWRKVGVPEPRILRYGEKDNFWGPAGNSGPCGPCSEIYYDFGEEFGCKRDSCAPDCGCGRFSEIWNLVFTQFNQDEQGRQTPLPKPNIDTGMGLERIAATLRGRPSVYETDLFVSLIQEISELSGKKYGLNDDNDNAMRIVSEHSRGITFLIADGVMPSNEGRGYVLRRLLRRAALFGKRLGLDGPFLVETIKTTIEQIGHVYPELVQRRDFITKVVELEEARFGETLSIGLELLDGIMKEAATKVKSEIQGEQAFKLYDTFGFPIELTTELAAKSGLSVDLKGFEQEMEKQRERARASHKFELNLNEIASLAKQISIQETPFAGYHNTTYKSNIIGLFVGGESKEQIQEGQEASLVLESTPFYGEMGGQVGDTGEIRSSSGGFAVINTIRVPPDIIVHQGHITKGSLSIGDGVEAIVNKERRLDIARNHTATHLLQAALRQVLGMHVQQRGSLVTPERFRFDFSHLIALTEDERQVVNNFVNRRIRQNLSVYDEEIPYKKAVEEGVIALFDEKYGGMVRVIEIGRPPVSAELCGGTHVASTGEIGFFHIISESSIGSGLRRIEAVTGREAEKLVMRHLVDLQETAEFLDAELDEVRDKVHSLVGEWDRERKRAHELESELARITAESLLEQVEVVKGVTILATRVRSFPQPILREMSDLIRERLKSAVVVLGTVYDDRLAFLAAVTPDLVAKGYDAVEIIRQVAKVVGGGGGGKATLAQAGGKNKDKLDEALQLVRSLI